jgi:outer membrane protein assembly factor BamB
MRTFFYSLALLLCFSSISSANWIQFRGQNNDGHAQGDVSLPAEWSETTNVIWKVLTEHNGWSTPVISDNQIWITSATEDGKDMFVYCYNAENGELLHSEKIFHNETPEPLGNDVNTYASCSSYIEEGRVYVHYGSYGTACINTETFETLWIRRDLHCNHYRGPASSLVMYKDNLILTMDGSDVQYQAALNKHDGSTVWITGRTSIYTDLDENGIPKREGDFRKAFCTPLIVEVDGEPHMYVSATNASYCYNPLTGDEIWKMDHPGYSPSSMALYGFDMAFVLTGRRDPDLVAYKKDARGHITDDDIVWKYNRAMPSMVSPILVDDFIYVVNNGGVATCLNAHNGEVVWMDRLEGTYYASPIYGDGKIYFCNEQGTATVLKPGDTLNIFAKNKLNDGFMASPAVYKNSLILRTTTGLYRIGK